jgi:N4-gp56 family major capsid protein
MARTIVGVNDPKAVKKYSGLLAFDTSQKGYWSSRFMGRGEAAEVPIQILTDLETDAGEQIFYDLLAEMRMAPVEGEDNLENNEERQRFYTDAVYIDQARCGVNTGGRMTRKRTLHNLREKGRRQQSNWWARVHDELTFMYMSGSRGVNPNFLFPTGYTGRANNAFATPDSNHVVYGGNATAFDNIDANDKFDLFSVGTAVTRAAVQGGGPTGIPVLQPCKIDGNETFVCVMHSWQEDDLRKSTTTGDWLDIQRAAAGAEGRNNAMFKGGLGMYRGVILHSHRNVIRFNNAGSVANVEAARALFLGSQAMVVAYGSPGTNMRFDWHEETRDNGDKVVISSSSIFGCKKVRFTTDEVGAQDFGCFAIDTACASR